MGSITQGDKFKSRFYGDIVVIQFKSWKEVLIEFVDTGYRCTVQSGQVRSGKVRDKIAPNALGSLPGFIGCGKHKSQVGGRDTRAYSVWRGMMARCYSRRKKDLNPSYKECFVCDHWMNFQNFADWFVVMDRKSGGTGEIDKDILVEGNKEYSPSTCCVVSKSLNSFMTDSGCKSRGSRSGASYDKRDKKYRPTIRNPFTGKSEHLGSFESEEHAVKAWRARKHELACKYAETVNDDRVATALRHRFKEN